LYSIRGVIYAFQNAVCGACGDIGTQCWVGTRGEASIVSANTVRPAIVGVEDDGAVHCCAAVHCAPLEREAGVYFCCVFAWLLSGDDCHEGSYCEKHF
jgi:hypothetical protein